MTGQPTTAARTLHPAGPLARPARPAARRAGLVALAVALSLVALASLAVGSRPIAASTVVESLLHYHAADSDHSVVVTLRLPRAVAGVLVGAALGLAGAVMQGVTRNPLADPGLLGVNGGAALAVVLAISVLGVTTPAGYVWFAFAGAAGAAVLVYAVGSRGPGGATPVKLALAGAAAGAAFTSLTTAVLLTDVATFDQYRFWTVGALTGRELGMVAQAAPLLLAGAVLALGTGRSLNALSLGDDTAAALGQRVGRDRAVAAAAAVALCGAATAIAGPIWFVGLVVPHLARLLTGPDYRWILPYSVLLAPILLLVADIVGRVAARPGELQVGIVTAFLGAPLLILLVRRHRRQGL